MFTSYNKNNFILPGRDGGGGPDPNHDLRPIEPDLAECAHCRGAVVNGVVGDHEGEGGVEEDVGQGTHRKREEDGARDGLVRLLRFISCIV